MKILLATHLFAPDSLAGASLYTDLAAYLKGQGHDVRVTSTFSYYPELQFRPSDRGVLYRDETLRGIPLRRVGMWLPQPHRGWRRLAPELVYLIALSLVGEHPCWKPDVIFTACPMLAQVAWQHFAYSGRRVPRLLVVQDSMAHAAIELGIIKNRWLGRSLHLFERWAFRSCDLFSTISPSMKLRVAEIRGEAGRCVVTPNWIHDSVARLIEAQRQATQTGPREVAGGLFYSGNFGVKQGLPLFLEMLEAARGDWTMRIHGGGAEAEALKSSAEQKTAWLTVGGLLEEEDYVDCLLTAGACVVTQMPGVGANFLPSKLLPALAAGVPVLAVCGVDSPLGIEVMEGGFGEVISPGDVDALSEILKRWREQPELLQRYGKMALQRSQIYRREIICGQYENLLMQLRESISCKIL